MNKSPQKSSGYFITTGVLYCLIGIVIIVFSPRIASMLDSETDYLFLGGMILIALGINNVAIMPMFINDKIQTKGKNKKG
jgi:hypothetical protein